jgi:4-hydroxybenzoate polyprenyltransferase
VVFAAPIFAREILDPSVAIHSLAGFVSFCLLSGVVYLFNDLRDRSRDAKHPRKRERPIASGRLSTTVAWIALGLLLPAAIALSAAVGRNFLGIAACYLLLNLLYSLLLRRLVILDVMGISAGFVLRAIAGAELLRDSGLEAEISAWLLLCAFFLSLFLGLSKRRHERSNVESSHRASLREYSMDFLDRLIGMTASVALVSYSIYTIWPDTVAKAGTDKLIFTVPFVFYGLARYLHLVLTEDKGGDPSEMLLTERSIILTVMSWIACVALILYGG